MNEKNFYIILGIVVILAIAYLFGGVYANGSGISTIKDELGQIRQDNIRLKSELNTVREGLADSRAKIGESRTTVITVRERIEADGQSLSEAKRVIDESKSIIDTVRKRNEPESK